MKLYIKNFQGIGEATLDLSGFTVLTGRSNSGKSTIRRAIELVLYNTWDAGYIKTGENHCIVKLIVDDNNYIQISKPENTYTVSIDGVKSSYPKVGRNTLEELEALGLDYFYDSEGYSYNVHIRGQTDPWYYITFSNQEQSRIIASIFNFDEIKSILKTSYKDKADLVSSAEKIAVDIDRLKVLVANDNERLEVLYALRECKTNQGVLLDYLNSQKVYREGLECLKGYTESEFRVNKLLEDINQYLITNSYIRQTEDIETSVNEISELNYTLVKTKQQLKIAEAVRKNLLDRDTLENYINIDKQSVTCESNIMSSEHLLMHVVGELAIANRLSSNLNVKTRIDKYLQLEESHYTANIEFNYMVSVFKELTVARNNLVRYNSIKKYLINRRGLSDIKKEIKSLRNNNDDISLCIDNVKTVLLLQRYVESKTDIESQYNNIDHLNTELSVLSNKLDEARVELNDSITCPHCSEPIGSFIKEHCHD